MCIRDRYNVRLIGEDSLSMEQKDMITDAAYYVPGKWMKRFVEDGWQVMFYTKKKYFEAPDTDMGIYYTCLLYTSSLVSDLLFQWLNPRIRFCQEEK